MGALASELLAKALAEATREQAPQPLEWVSRAMGARVDLDDREAVDRLPGALMRQHGVSTIFTADRGFRRFPGITARDPYAEAAGPAIP